VHFFRISLNQLNFLRLLSVSNLFNLFSIFIEISLVSGFKQSHTSRAICCRLEKAIDPVRVHHPMLGKTNEFCID
jgi:hypothetical protein